MCADVRRTAVVVLVAAAVVHALVECGLTGPGSNSGGIATVAAATVDGALSSRDGGLSPPRGVVMSLLLQNMSVALCVRTSRVVGTSGG